MENLRTLFWNSNGWDVEKARRISQVAADERAHVICIVDTRQDDNDAGKKLSTLKFLLQLKTGMKWKSFHSPPPSGAKAGGSFSLISEMVKSSSYIDLIGGGILTELKIRWGGKDLKVLSIYRPAVDQADGSLRKAGNKMVGKDLDVAISEALEVSMTNPNSLLGGDFNLDRISTARFLLKAGIRNALCDMDEEAPTFRRFVKGRTQESSIDHVAWTGMDRNGSM
jgi:hypothetical protein